MSYFGMSSTATRIQNGWTRILGGWTDIGMAGQKASIKVASGTQYNIKEYELFRTPA